jgi:hypothetical protein
MNLHVNLIGEAIEPTISVMPAADLIPNGSGHIVEIAMECGLTLTLDDWQAIDLNEQLTAAVRDLRNDQPGIHTS